VRRTQKIPCPQLVLGPSQQASSMAHLNKSREAQGHNNRWEPKIRTSKEGTPCLGPIQSCPRRHSAPVSRCKTHHPEPWGAALQITFRINKGCSLGV